MSTAPNVLAARERLQEATNRHSSAEVSLEVLRDHAAKVARLIAEWKREHDGRPPRLIGPDVLDDEGRFTARVDISENEAPTAEQIEAAEERVAETERALAEAQAELHMALNNPQQADAGDARYVCAVDRLVLFGEVYRRGEAVPEAELDKLPTRKRAALLSVGRVRERLSA